MPQDRLEQKLRQLGLSNAPASAKRLTFRLYFPRPPYGPVEYLAAKQGDGLNFVGQLLGHGGCTLKKIQNDSGARVEVHDGKGNLNGTHPSYTDPSLHAVVFAESREKLAKAARMIADVLRPVDAAFERFEVVPGGSALLRPVLPSKKTKSPRSEGSSRSNGAWIRASTPSSENDSCPAQPTDLDSAYVQEPTLPWRSVKTLQPPSFKSPLSQSAVKKPVEKENSLGELREWKTWGSNASDGYSQFTALTQDIVSQYAAAQPRPQPTPQIPSYFEPFRSSSVYSLGPTQLNGANSNSSFTGSLTPTTAVSYPRMGLWEKEGSKTGMEGFPLPRVYEDLIGDTQSASPVPQQSRLMHAYHISTTSDPPTQKSIQQRMALPHDL